MRSEFGSERPNARRLLETHRLVLEPLEPRHAPELFQPLRDVSLYRFIPQDPPGSETALQERYERLATGRSPDGTEIWLNWAAREATTGAVVGTFQATARANHTADIAYIILGHAQRRGFASEGAAAVIAHLRDDHEIVSVVADIDTRNSASIALIERLGFTRVRTTRDADSFKGATSDEYRYERVLGRG